MYKSSYSLDPVLLIGLLLSLFIPSTVWLLNVSSIETSTIFSFLGIIITLQIDQIFRLERNKYKGQKYSQLMKDLESIPWLENNIFEMSSSVANIFSDKNKSHFFAQSKNHILMCKSIIQKIESGYLETPYDDVQPLIDSVESTDKIMRAISVTAIDVDFWNSAEGEKLWKANEDALRRISIERIFVLTQLTPDIEAVIQRHHESGVDCYLVNEDKLRNSSIEDIIIFDEAMAYRAIVNAKGDPVKNSLSSNPIDIAQKIKHFNKIKTLSKKYEPMRSDDDKRYYV